MQRLERQEMEDVAESLGVLMLTAPGRVAPPKMARFTSTRFDLSR